MLPPPPWIPGSRWRKVFRLLTHTHGTARHRTAPRPRNPQFAQELLSTFSTALGEVALQPSTGGTFVVELVFVPPSEAPGTTAAGSKTEGPAGTQQRRVVLWDRRLDGGFPETKELKRRVRDAIEPGRNLGHVDRDHAKSGEAPARTLQQQQQQTQTQPTVTGPAGNDGGGGKACEDCP